MRPGRSAASARIPSAGPAPPGPAPPDGSSRCRPGTHGARVRPRPPPPPQEAPPAWGRRTGLSRLADPASRSRRAAAPSAPPCDPGSAARVARSPAVPRAARAGRRGGPPSGWRRVAGLGFTCSKRRRGDAQLPPQRLFLQL